MAKSKRGISKKSVKSSPIGKCVIYMAKPIYGGWVSFTSHLCLKTGYPLYRIGKRTEAKKDGTPTMRPYGYGVKYQNLSISDVLKLSTTIIVSAIDKNYYQYLDELPDGTFLVIHDPTEVKKNSGEPVIRNLKRFRIITIRKTVQDYLKKQFDIDSTFMVHPFYPYFKQINGKVGKKKSGAVSISRVDYDKHTEVIIDANSILRERGKPIIEIYGAKNDRYVFYKLQEKDNMKESNPKSSYKGTFDKSFEAVHELLGPKKFMVDLSAIRYDGGGSQYTFLEAMYEECVLVLNRKWLESSGKKGEVTKMPKTKFKDGKNCFVVSNDEELADLVSKKKSGLSKIVSNSRKLLEPHLKVNWNRI